MFTSEEEIRYMRQFRIHGWGKEGQEKLKNMTVCVAGCGGSGSPTLTQLALLGIGHLRICDFDSFELSNKNRQFIHEVGNDDRIGMNKAQSAAMTIKNINPNVEVTVFDKRLTDDNIDEFVGDADVIFDCVDNFESKFMISRCAVRKNIPHMFFGMFDINIFACIFYPPKTPCFHCLFDHEKLIYLKEMEELLKRNDRADTKMKIPVCAPSLFICTGLLITEMLKMFLGLAPVIYNEYIMILQKNCDELIETDGYQGMRFWNTKHFENISAEQGFDWEKGYRGNYMEQIKLRPDPECICCGKAGKAKV